MMLVSSVGFSADFHFCQGEFKNFALFVKAKSCHEIAAMHASCHGGKKKTKSCHQSEEKNTKVSCGGEEKDGCCTNNTELVQLDTDYSYGGHGIENSVDVVDLLAIVPTEIKLTHSNFSYPSAYQNYKPPLLVNDLRIQFQSFLC